MYASCVFQRSTQQSLPGLESPPAESQAHPQPEYFRTIGRITLCILFQNLLPAELSSYIFDFNGSPFISTWAVGM